MDPRLRKKIIILSILLHLLLFLLWEGGKRLDLLGDDPKPEEKEVEAPIVFDLQQPQQRPNRVIETPEDAEVVKKQDKADFLSDKNALARNQEPAPDVKLGDSYSKGLMDTRELPQNQGPLGTPQPPPQPQPQTEQNEKKAEKKGEEEDTQLDPSAIIREKFSKFDEEYMQRQQRLTHPGIQDRLPSVNHDNRQTRAQNSGGLSFNTYDWDFAPYMLMLKRRIQRNIFPPHAFSYLGLIDGETLLRFKIFPNGQLKDLEIIKYKGHRSLMETSQNAISISAPFPRLPSDFPEPYLEVTGKFSYLVHRRKRGAE